MTNKKQRSKRALRPEELTETDLAQNKMGRNALQGQDQFQVHNQRYAVPVPEMPQRNGRQGDFVTSV